MMDSSIRVLYIGHGGVGGHSRFIWGGVLGRGRERGGR